MITRLDRNRLHGEKRALLDEAAEESRLANISGRQLESIADLIHKKHEECIDALKEEHDIDDVIKAYRRTIHRLLKRI